jgi:hypothetical protein
MHSRAIRLNPGGSLLPQAVVGRDAIIARVWRALEQQSVLLTAERRMGKTSLLRKLAAEPPAGHVAIMRSVEDVFSPNELVRHLLYDLKAHCPGLLKQSLRERLEKAGVRNLGVGPLAVEFDPRGTGSWKDVLADTFAALDERQDDRVVLLWDELPHMVANVSAHVGPLAGREILDFLRAQRQSRPGIRMVFSGSIGLHHVVGELRSSAGAWAPVNDMRHIELPPLDVADGRYLAAELLRNEQVACNDVDALASEIAAAVECVPFYIHLVVQALEERGAPVAPSDIERLVTARLRDPNDPWSLLHYIDRIKDYYGDAEAPIVKALLDAVAKSETPLDVEELHSRISAEVEPPTRERLHELLDLLGKDHYLSFDNDGRVAFRLNLLRGAWRARRRLSA